MGYIIEVPFPLDIFDAATNRCLPGYEHGVVDFKREQTTLGSVIYHLRQEQLGNLGSIEIHKIHPEITEVHFIDPPMPNDQEAIQYLAKTKLADKVNLFQEITKLIDSNAPISLVALVACELVQPEKVAQRNNKHGATDWYLALPKDEARPLIDSVNRALRDARNTFHAKRKEHYRLVLEAFENRLHDDGAWKLNIGANLHF
ncbi:MAG: hypothetical protein H6656_13480 [Ardenticatenaceae bacterium]|nr:hypothetical protein [Ardenticatenaceae bacterium]